MNFDQKARDWDKDPQKVQRAKVFAEEIINFLGNNKIEKALEFGSGTGLVSFQLKDHFRTITLADNSQGMTEVLKEKIQNEKISNMRPLLIDILEESHNLSGFDIIYTLLTLHHIEETGKAFEVFNKILKPGGYLCIGDLVSEDGSFHHKDPGYNGHKGFDTETFRKLLASKGFDTEVEKVFTVIEREHNSMIKKYPLFLTISKKHI